MTRRGICLLCLGDGMAVVTADRAKPGTYESRVGRTNQNLKVNSRFSLDISLLRRRGESELYCDYYDQQIPLVALYSVSDRL